jgi:4-hydroxy-3-polyprenylbenzoate decarboxylase
MRVLDAHVAYHNVGRRYQMNDKTITVAVTGASGVAFAMQLLKILDADTRVKTIHFVASKSSLRVIAEELNLNGRHQLIEQLLGKPSDKTQQLDINDIGASVASGSYPTDAMIVLPCSMATLGGIAHGLSSNLIQRAADVILKERRSLVLCVRETPLSTIHLRNMHLAAEAGAVIFPISPSFYNHPTSVEHIIEHYVNRVLTFIGLPQPNAYVWKKEVRATIQSSEPSELRPTQQ